MFFDLVIQIHYMKNIHQLTFVLVKSLYLYVENRIGIYFDSIVLQNIFCQTHLILIFNVHELLLSSLVICINFQLRQFRQICDPAVPNVVSDPGCQQRVSMKEETSLCDTVCLVIEFFRVHLIEISQLLLFQDLCVQLSHTVYRIAAGNSQMSHLHLSVIDNGHLADLFLISGIFCLDLLNKSPVDLFNDLVNTRKQFREQLNRPFFQSFCHNGMVCICAGMGSDVPCLIPGQVLLINQDTHQFGHCHGRMGIV